jgi:hypothetical protein
MKVSDIINTVNTLLSLNLPACLFSDGAVEEEVNAVVDTNFTLGLLVNCVNYCVSDLALDYCTNVARGTVTAVDGFVDTSSLEHPLLEILQLTDQNGCHVKYRYTEGGILCKSNGILDITYTCQYPEVTYHGNITLSNPKIDTRVLSYGVAAEYCLLTSDYETMSIWDKRYRDVLQSAVRKNSEKRMPKRRWI